MTEFERFLNRLKIMHSLDGYELAGLSPDQAQRFTADPTREMIRLDDGAACAIWTAILRREPDREEALSPLEMEGRN